MGKFFILGSLNYDLSIDCETIPKAGETVIGNSFFTNPGGKGGNQAVAIAKMGGNATILGAVGNDLWGKELRKSLERNNINCKYLETKPGSSGVAVIVVSNGDNRIIVDSGANYKYKFKDFSEILKKTAKRDDYFVTQLENKSEVVEEGLKYAKSLGLTTILNPAPAKILSEEAYENIDYLIPNEHEAYYLSGLNKEKHSLAEVFDFFVTKKVKNVIITLGHNGCAYTKDGEIYYQKAIEENAIDTTAAGDTFIGAFAVKLSETKSIKAAIEYANIASAITITKKGAQQAIPLKSEISDYVKQMN